MYETFEQFRKNAVEFYEKMVAYLQSLPITSYLKEKFDQVSARMRIEK